METIIAIIITLTGSQYNVDMLQMCTYMPVFMCVHGHVYVYELHSHTQKRMPLLHALIEH